MAWYTALELLITRDNQLSIKITLRLNIYILHKTVSFNFNNWSCNKSMLKHTETEKGIISKIRIIKYSNSILLGIPIQIQFKKCSKHQVRVINYTPEIEKTCSIGK